MKGIRIYQDILKGITGKSKKKSASEKHSFANPDIKESSLFQESGNISDDDFDQYQISGPNEIEVVSKEEASQDTPPQEFKGEAQKAQPRLPNPAEQLLNYINEMINIKAKKTVSCVLMIKPHSRKRYIRHLSWINMTETRT